MVQVPRSYRQHERRRGDVVVLPDQEAKTWRIWGTGELEEEAPRGQAGDLGTTSLLNKARLQLRRTSRLENLHKPPRAKALLVAPLREAIFTT